MANVILVVNLPGFLPIPDMRQRLQEGHDASYYCVSSEAAALSALKASHEKFLLCLVNGPSLQIFSAAREFSPNLKTVLVSSQIITDYMTSFGDQFINFVDHVIANRIPKNRTENEVLILLNKYLLGEKVSLRHYLKPSTHITQRTLQSSTQRDEFYQEVGAFVKGQVKRGSITKAAQTITEELLMNALYDAPHAAGKINFENTDRSAPFSLADEDVAHLSYGFDGEILAISVKDPFGLLKKELFLKYMSKVMRRSTGESMLDKKKLGAGIGLFMILYNCHSLVCSVESKTSTEVIALINTALPIRDINVSPRTICFFE